MHTDQIRYKIGIGMIPKIGPVLTKRLVAYCGSTEGVFREKRSGLLKIPGIGERLADHIISNRNLDKADEEIEWIGNNGIQILFYLDEDYPERLKQCEDAPVILYIRGNTRYNRSKIVSIVGTRTPTDYGRSVTRELVDDLAVRYPDILIVSGLAYGIDICAHRSALRNNLDTVAVLGHGFSYLYPSAHRETAAQIVQKGALVTEFLHGDKPESANFVRRNRIIAGLADATVVVESGEQGGALITADIANSYNRDVFAIPGKVTDKFSTGCNRLIRSNRAALMESLADLEYIMGWQQSVSQPDGIQKSLFVELDAEESSMVELLRSNVSLTIDQIAIHANLPVSKASTLLLNLEFKGVVKCLPGKVYRMV